MFLVSTNRVFAQDSLKANVFHVDKVLKPLLSESMKIQSNPNPEVPEIKAPVFEYTNIPDKRHDASPTIYTIKPLAMGTSLLPKLKNNYTKFGYGNYNTPLFEVYYNTLRNKDLQAGIFAKHLSSHPDGNNEFSNNHIQAFAKKFSTTGMLEADISYNRNNIYLYGFTPDNAIIFPSDIRQLFQCYEIKAGYSNIVKDSNSITYKLGGAYYNFGDNGAVTENDFKLKFDLNKRLQGNPLEIKTSLQITDIKNKVSDYQRVYFNLDPRYTLNMSDLYLTLGFNSTIFSDSAKTTIHPFPVAEAGYGIIPKLLTGYAGITGNLKPPTYRNIINENAFTRGIDFKNTINKFEIYGGFKGMLGPQTSFMAQASWSSVQNMMFYATDSFNYKSQRVIYDTTNAGLTHLKAEITHEFSNNFRLAVTVNYYSYNLKTFDHPYGKPTFESKLNAMYNIGDKFILRADIFTMNKRYTKVIGTTATDESLNAIIDLNTGIDYLYSKNVSVFLNLNNLTNQTYQRWYNYPSYGFNILGGLTVTF